MCAGRPLPFHGPLAKGAQLVEKSLAEFRVRRRESNTIRFLPRHVRGGKHFARSERRIVRYQRTTEAQSAAKLSRKSGKANFSTVSPKARRAFGAARHPARYSSSCRVSCCLIKSKRNSQFQLHLYMRDTILQKFFRSLAKAASFIQCAGIGLRFDGDRIGMELRLGRVNGGLNDPAA